MAQPQPQSESEAPPASHPAFRLALLCQDPSGHISSLICINHQHFFSKLVLRKPLFKQRKLPSPSVASVLFYEPNSFTSTRRLAIFPSIEPFATEVVTFASRSMEMAGPKGKETDELGP